MKKNHQAPEGLGEHPFAPYIRTLGKGRQGSRALSPEEAEAAFTIILQGEALPMQIGAFLMLLRVKEETAEELAGFVRAVHKLNPPPAGIAKPRLDWPAYAGKRRQLPWFVLSALLLAKHGISVCMHGTSGFDPDRVFVPEALAALGIPEANSLTEASLQIERDHFAFLRLKIIHNHMEDMLQLRPILGLRSPINSLARMLNPLDADASLIGIFHPSYRDTHHNAAHLLQLPRCAVLKGEGGEAERSPDSPCLLKSAIDGVSTETNWPALLDKRQLKDQRMDPKRLLTVWRGEDSDIYGEAAVIATTAVALYTLGEVNTTEAADKLARQWWNER